MSVTKTTFLGDKVDGILSTIFSRSDALRRQLYDMLTNPRDYASMVAGRTQEAAATAEALQNQAFNPQRPTQVVNPQALSKLTDMIMAGPMGFAPAGITAYHGSPYLFRQFDAAKVGTGEGAQAYGVGAGYTAEARPVAENYRKTLSKDSFLSPNGSVINKNKLIDFGFDKSSAEVMLNAIKNSNGDFEKAAELIGRARPSAANFLRGLSGAKLNPGYIYKGDIPDEILPKFLDWDKPLSQQSEEVQDVIKKLGLTETASGSKEPTGAYIYEALARRLNPTDNSIKATSNVESANLATKKLEEMGIRGIRYLDQESRGSYKAQLIYKDKPYSDVIEFKTKDQLDDYIKESEAKGFGVKTFPQTSNFIPFRPEDYKIEQINDIPLEQWYAKGLLDRPMSAKEEAKAAWEANPENRDLYEAYRNIRLGE